MKNKDYATFGVGGKKGVLWEMCKWRIGQSFPLFLVTAPGVSANVNLSQPPSLFYSGEWFAGQTLQAKHNPNHPDLLSKIIKKNLKPFFNTISLSDFLMM